MAADSLMPLLNKSSVDFPIPGALLGRASFLNATSFTSCVSLRSDPSSFLSAPATCIVFGRPSLASAYILDSALMFPSFGWPFAFLD